MIQEPETALLSIAEVFEKYPKLMKKLRWTPKMMNAYIKGGLLDGDFDNTLKAYVCEAGSIKRLISFRNGVLMNQIIDL